MRCRPPLVLLALSWPLAAWADAPSPSDWRQAVSADRIEADLRVLVGADAPSKDEAPLVSRAVQHPDLQRAEAWLVDALDDIRRIEVWTEAVTVEGAEPTSNVIGELPGRTYGLPPVVIAAHYDSTASLEPGWDPATDPAPGADDDASGVAAVLEAARVLADWRPGFERPIRFILFTAEEVGLLGSTQYVEGMVADGGDVAVVLVLDPVGYDPGGEGRLWVATHTFWAEEGTALEDLVVPLGSPLTVTAVDGALVGDDRSDHHPFWQAGFPAVHAGAFPLAPTYHTPSDVLDVVSLDFVAEATALATARAAEVARPREPAGLFGCTSVPRTVSPAWWLVMGALVYRRRRTAT